ncbi:HAMP domain-containing histidine kinase [Geodermatophilaceae bacterium NBWT11]|nr:HAMP domain-containing histidine kinase [Geodermatophilaceae bacterium NBWT11]
MSRRSSSLRSRLSWSASAVVGVWVLLLALGANLLLAQALSGQADSVLRARAQATAATVGVAADGSVSVDESADDRALDVGTWILGSDGGIVEAPPGSSATEDAAARDLAGRGEQTAELGVADPVRLLAQPVVVDGAQVATVVTSTSLAPYRQLERIALWGSIGVALLLLVVVHLVLRANVTRALRPVQQMSGQAARWSADDVDRRFGAQPRPAELAELAGTLDGVLDRLSAVLRHEQRLSAELSHELRTPIARIRAEAELLAAHPGDPDETTAAARTIGASATELADILQTLMTTARGGQTVAPGRSELTPVLTELADSPLVYVDAPAGTVVGLDAALLRRVLQPVVDNAVRHARTRVDLIGTASTDGVRVRVVDDGPGVAAGDVDRVFAPGWRAAPDDGHDGAGLGLALTRRLLEAAGGQVRAEPGPGGRFELVLPAG